MEIEKVEQYTTPQVFRNTVRKNGGRVAMRIKEYGLWHDISWSQYYQRVEYVGAALLALGLEKDQCVSIIGDNCHEWVTIDLGIHCAGGVAVGIYATNASPQVQYVVGNSDSVIFFVENEEQLDKWMAFRDKVPYLKKVIVWDLEGLRSFEDPMVMTFDELLKLGKREIEKDPGQIEKRMTEVKPEDTAVLIYTSGTTGPPKGAMLSHNSVIWMANRFQEMIDMSAGDEILSFLPLCHIFERMFSVFGHITIGYILNFVEKPDTVMENMVEVSPTIGYAVPRIWEKYYSNIYVKMSDADWIKRIVYKLACGIGARRTALKLENSHVPVGWELLYRLAYIAVFRKLKKRLGFDRMRVGISGAAPISPDVLMFFQSIGVDMVEGYGQTEGTGATSITKAGSPRFGTVGQPLSGIEVRIAADGEILIRAPSVFKGYFKNPEATKKTIVDGWLHTGDVGKMDEDGNLRITDRKKDIIVTAGGKNLTPQFIENKLKMSPYINDAVVIGDKRKYVTCLIMLDEDTVVKYAQDNKIQFSTYRDLTQNPDIDKLIRSELAGVNKTLSQVEQPKKFTILPKKLYVEDGEVTPTMKVKRGFVNETFGDLIEAMY
ncbi:MAG: long-chain fatty acid--CoA ligase [Proteobacteria bacterium]|nr:long-chain fatty acid--CoA ligase [Pseudomonadota bacterium]